MARRQTKLAGRVEKDFYDHQCHQCDGPAGLSRVFVDLSRFRDRLPN